MHSSILNPANSKEYRRLDIADSSAVAALERRCFGSGVSEQSVAQRLNDGQNIFFGCFCNKSLCGYGGISFVVDEAYIDNIATDEGYRRQGIANELLTRLISYSRKGAAVFITLEVRASNAPAISLYQKHGFSAVATRRKYYSAPVEDALIMTKYFSEAKHE